MKIFSWCRRVVTAELRNSELQNIYPVQNMYPVQNIYPGANHVSWCT